MLRKQNSFWILGFPKAHWGGEGMAWPMLGSAPHTRLLPDPSGSVLGLIPINVFGHNLQGDAPWARAHDPHREAESTFLVQKQPFREVTWCRRRVPRRAALSPHSQWRTLIGPEDAPMEQSSRRSPWFGGTKPGMTSPWPPCVTSDLTACCSRAVTRACGERGLTPWAKQSSFDKGGVRGKMGKLPGTDVPLSLQPPLPPHNPWTWTPLRMRPKAPGQLCITPWPTPCSWAATSTHGRQRWCSHVLAMAPLHLQMGTETSPRNGSQHPLLPQDHFNNLLYILLWSSYRIVSLWLVIFFYASYIHSKLYYSQLIVSYVLVQVPAS